MKTHLDCLACFVRQALDAVRAVNDDPRIHEAVVRSVLTDAGRMDYAESPPAMAQRIHRRIRELTGDPDPYAQRKEQLNRLALELRDELRERVERAVDPLDAAVRLAIAGNLMDLGAKTHLDESNVRDSILACFDEDLDGNVAAFRRDLAKARDILYLADNAGEIVLDRLLLERLPLDRTVVAVKGGPIINDATMDDARVAGVVGLVEVIDNGSDAPGTILDDCSEDFRRRFDRADLIIAKGQGNYETLAGLPRPIYFLLRVKCALIAHDIRRPLGSMVLSRAEETPQRDGTDHRQ